MEISDTKALYTPMVTSPTRSNTYARSPKLLNPGINHK